MPHYDESFIHDDNLNQRKNKRSYHVYKHGLNPLSLLERSDVLHALEERGTSVIKRNIRNIKQRGARKPPSVTHLTKCEGPDIIIDHCPRISCFDPNKYYDIRNNNISLASCKSLDNLTLNHVKKTNDRKIRSGTSLQNLLDEERLQHYASPVEDSNGGPHKGDIRSYCLSEARRKPMQRRLSRGIAAPGFGVYRQISSDGQNNNKSNEGDLCSGESGSGHRGSLRGANKLARRARSFKDDLLERISNMRSPQQQHHAPHLSSGFRSHSPLSPKLRNMGTKTATVEEGEVTPAKELERLVKDVTFGLKHFSDVITKRKLEMLPDNGTLVFESIANIHKAIKPYCSRSPQLTNAVKRLCNALAMLIRLCDDITAVNLRGESEEGNQSLQPEHVSTVVKGVTQAVEDVAKLAQQYMARPALDPRPAAIVSPRPNTQRNSLPDIPLTPKERSLLTGSGGTEGSGVRASHSSESVLDAPHSPPPKPARPNRKMEMAPPLPPKRKSNDISLLAISIDGLSLQSHSSGSLDSMLNVSNDEETRNAHDSTNHDHVFATASNTDIVGVCMCNNGLDGRASLDSTHESNTSAHLHSHSNHNRFSNESGFVSVGHQEQSSEHSFTSTSSSHHYSNHTDSSCAAGSAAPPPLRNKAQAPSLTSAASACSATSLSRFGTHGTFDSTEYVSEMKCTRQSFESRMNMINANCVTSNVTAHQLSSQNINMHSSRLASVTSDETETPPELPAKTRRNMRADVQQHFPNVEIRPSPICSLHGEGRPHTLADHHPPRPPPLPLKKKHIMAYMEMFGKQLEQNNATQNPDMFRHSIHTYGLASAQHTTAGGLSVQRQQHVQRTIAQSLTIQHFGTTPLSGSEDSVSMTTSSGTSPIPPPEPPALPPKMNKNKQIQMNSSNELLPPPSPRPCSYTSSSDETVMNSVSSEDPYVTSSGPGKFPLEDELEILVQPMPSPVPSQRSQRSENSIEPTVAITDTTTEPVDADDVILHTDVNSRLVFNTDKEGPEVKGGQPDALVVLATKATKDFAYQEAFLATYRTWLTPKELVERLIRRANHFKPRPHELRSTLSLLTRVVADLTMVDLEPKLMQKIMTFIYWLVEVEELAIAKALRQILVDKQKQLHSQQQSNHRYEYDSPCSGAVSLSRDTLVDFKSHEVAEQMTLLDAALFARITTAEVLSWPRDQSEESSPNLTRFTAHFNNMSYWARSRILEQVEVRERERYANKFLKVMKVLRKINNFNSYLALVSALDSPPVRRLGWPRSIEESVREHCALIDSSCSFRAYRHALYEASPPCIPYIGLVLQDLTFVHVGNPDHLSDGSINFSKRWQQYHIMENMKRFQKQQYKFKRNERIQAMFNEFDDVLSEDAMWQISKTIKPSDGRSAN